MSRVSELHPEHLLDKEIHGDLDEAERARLDEHVAQCGTCRMERQLRADFADEIAKDMPQINITEILSGERVSRNVVPPPPRAWRYAWLVAAAIFFVVVSAVASSGTMFWAPIFIREQPERTVIVTASPAKERKYPPPPQSVLASPLTVTGDPPPPQVSVPQETAAMIFDQESEARRRGDYVKALELHSSLVTRFPQSREAQVSRVTIARMLLDRGDPASALAGFDAYLKNGSGELGEDAMVGRATALERLHRDDEAKSAWQALLATYPGSSFAPHAREALKR